MRGLIAVATTLVAACFNPRYDRPACGPASECPNDLRCTGGFCVALDASGPMPDAPVCFGTGIVAVCLQQSPSSPLVLAPASGVLNTDTDCAEVVPQSGGPSLCVWSGTKLTVPGGVFATGSRPLVLLAVDQVMLPATGILDASSSAAGKGAATTPLPCSAVGAGTQDEGGGAGGAGGSFGTVGGKGGDGDLNNTTPGHAPGGTPDATIGVPLVLRGGCSGGPGGDGRETAGGVGGAGGGAIALISTGSIVIEGNVFASGGGGGNGAKGPGGGSGGSGGAGGGPGGMILLDAPSIRITGRVVANGGAGGGGGGELGSGQAGQDGTTVDWDRRAIGGDGAMNAGRGADGTTGAGPASDLDGTAADAGGGGGAGGLGVIVSYGAVEGAATVSPPVVRR